MTAYEITKLLATRHAGDIFVPECKDGPTQNDHHIRLDAWAMNRSWRHMCLSGYEIKVSRSDFISDHKWQGYLNLCNEFWFVAPPGIISKNELPLEVGLLEVSKTGGRLFAKKRPAWREIKPPVELLYYIMMCRAKITKDTSDRASEWRAWLEQKVDNRVLGYNVSRGIRDHVSKVECENMLLKQQNQNYEGIKRACIAVGLHTERVDEWQFTRKLDEVKKVIPPELEDALLRHRNAINTLLSELGKIKTP